jgi:hypothetical protein
VKWSINAAAIEFGVDRRTLAKGLRDLDVEITPKAKYHSRDIVRALYGDLDYERTRNERAAANLRELEYKEKQHELVPMSEVQSLYTQAMLPWRQALLAMPSELASRVNPTDPVFAQQQAQAWVDARLPIIQAELPKPKKK